MIVIFWYYFQRCRRTGERLSEKMGDIVTEEIVVHPCPAGIVVRLGGSMARFSGRYPWQIVPRGAALLRILYDGEPAVWFDRLIERLETIGVTRDEVGRVLGVDSREVGTVLNLLPNMTSRCPMAEIDREACHVLAMDRSELEQYVGEFL